MKMTEKEEETLRRRSVKLLENCCQFHRLVATFDIEKFNTLLNFSLNDMSQMPFYDKNNRLDCKMVEKWGQTVLRRIGKFEKDLKKQKQKIQKALYLCKTKESKKTAKRQKKK